MAFKLKHVLLGVAASALMAGQALAEKIIIGHFGNPTPMQLLSTSDALAKETGWEIEWRKFDAGTDVIAAMASGDVVLSELGSSPVAIGTSSGLDIQLIAYSDVIGKAESLIAHNGSGIKTIADLKGKRVAVPIGSTAHYSLMGALQHEGLTEADVTIVGMPPDQIAASWEQGVIDAAWIWQPVQSEILKTGELIVGADQTAEWGFPTYDGWVVNREFAEANKDKIVAFLKEIDRVNGMYLANPAAWTPDSAEVKALAAATGADPAQVPGILEGFTFLPMATQVSDTWLGGAAPKIKVTAEFLKSAGRIDTTIDDYSAFVNPSYAQAAAQ
ncbi:ABC transporter substrate-binding protein [Tabrizicola sp. J26]|uniref:taurine ABC transporter substrate-binding protein n=1 Tax=Alitabrizicola rongguiensis TaxID=2909234 RepID=UPI001F4596CC|nr:ABC transporter substrate-binding protein [Tabrizicola rongguiensis]MCF1709373.1 ABC transporter substrate-binding protein [Tabrizicola rongguiensis]